MTQREPCPTCPFAKGSSFRNEDFFVRGHGVTTARELGAVARAQGKTWRCHETTGLVLSDQGEPCVGFRS